MYAISFTYVNNDSCLQKYEFTQKILKTDVVLFRARQAPLMQMTQVVTLSQTHTIGDCVAFLLVYSCPRYCS